MAPGARARIRHALTPDPRATHLECLQILHQREVGRITGAQQPALQTVVLHRIHARRPQRVEHIHALGHRARHQCVDVPHPQHIGMCVIHAEHALLRRLLQHGPQRLEVARSGTLADEDVHAKRRLAACFIQRHALVVRADARSGVHACLLTHQLRRVTIHRLARGLRCGDLGQHLRIARQHARPVHHLAQVADARVGQQARDGGGIQCGPRRLKRGRRHARWASKVKVEIAPRTVAQHELHTRLTQHVGDLVRIAHRAHGAMHHHRARKLAGRQHAAFHMHMRVDESRHQIARVHRAAARRDRLDATIAHAYFARSDRASVQIHHLVSQREGVHAANVVRRGHAGGWLGCAPDAHHA